MSDQDKGLTEEFSAESDVFAKFETMVSGAEAGGGAPSWEQITKTVLGLYTAMPEDQGAEKDRAFAILEVLAGRAPVGADLSRKAIMDLYEQGDQRAHEKIMRMTRRGVFAGMPNAPVEPTSETRAENYRRAKAILGQRP